jgi:hypothetical protein
MSSVPDAMPEWPYPGGLSEQPAKVVEAFDLLRFEMPHLHSKKPKPEKKDAE